nr:unnamed protein product [Callosobruchus chinensis]
MKYIAQIGTKPPAFSLVCNVPESVDESYKRYLTNGLRKNFFVEGVPIKKRKIAYKETFGFKTNGGEVDIQYDNSWTKNKDELYTKEEIARIDSDTRVVTSMQTKSVSSCEYMHRG